MTRRERLLATLKGEPVDRAPVCFYEINGIDQRADDPDPFNIHSDPSWKPVLDLARERSDVILRRNARVVNHGPDPLAECTESETWFDEQGRRFTRTSIQANGHKLTSLSRRDPDVNTVWEVKHLLESEADLEAWIDLPGARFSGEIDISPVRIADEAVGDAGIVAIDTGDPICAVAGAFDMAEFLVIAATNKPLMHRALEKVSEILLPRVEAVAKALPGRLWRICGAEYASPPYLRPELFEEYVTRYDTPMVEAIQRHGGYARMHCHGRTRDIMDHIAATGCTGLDPIEPPPQGDVELSYIRERYGRQMVLFGNIEASDIENCPAGRFERKVRRAVAEGTAGEGRGFVLMPSACPYGRKLPDLARINYETMIRVIEEL
jgi:hypothetical protein